jgi:beta-N-acetylhexosaminidase
VIPWYVTEAPTASVSLTQPNHLIDVLMAKTVVHAHNPSLEAIHASVEKITGGSLYAGTVNDNVWCNTFGTRLNAPVIEGFSRREDDSPFCTREW